MRKPLTDLELGIVVVVCFIAFVFFIVGVVGPNIPGSANYKGHRHHSHVEQAANECEIVWIGPEAMYSEDTVTDFCVIEVGDGE